MFKWRHMFRISSVLFLLTPNFSYAGIASYKYEWEEVHKSDYYIITIIDRFKNYPIYTRHRVLYLEQPETLWVSAFDDRDEFLSSPAVSTKKMWVAEGEEIVKPLSKTPKAPPSAPLTKQQKAKLKEIKELEAEEKAAFNIKPFRDLSAFAGVGKETLTLTGGNSSFKGSSIITPLGGDLLVRTGSAEKPSPFSFHMLVYYYYFITNEQTDQSDTDSNQGELSYRRVNIDVMGQYRILSFSKSSFYGMLGLTYFELPEADNDPSTSITDFKTNTIYATKIGLGAQTSFFGNGSLNLDVYTIPLSLSSSTLSAFWLNLYAQHFILSDLLYGRVDLFSHQVTAKSKVDCGTTTTCQTSGSSQSSSSGMSVGVGLHF
jgi:hypothetical protein